MNILVVLTAGIALVNVALLISLLTIYARIYKKTKGASFTIGLIFFRRNVDITQYNCSLHLFCDGVIIFHGFAAVLCGNTFS
jgi:hypothetical protein